MKIEFFGDSFSEEKTRIGCKHDTYISLLEKEYKTKIKINSKGGCSHWDIIINQFLPKINDLPDVCIFTWPDEFRMYHRRARHIRLKEAIKYSDENYKFLKIGYDFGFFRKEWQAAEMFYKYLFDEEKNDIEYLSSLYYFDNVILEKIKDKKFIHLWSFEKRHNWKNNIELKKPLINIAEEWIPEYHPKDGKEENENILAPNHLPTQELNEYVFKNVKDLIDEVCR